MSFHKKETEKNWVSGQTWTRVSRRSAGPRLCSSWRRTCHCETTWRWARRGACRRGRTSSSHQSGSPKLRWRWVHHLQSKQNHLHILCLRIVTSKNDSNDFQLQLYALWEFQYFGIWQVIVSFADTVLWRNSVPQAPLHNPGGCIWMAEKGNDYVCLANYSDPQAK